MIKARQLAKSLGLEMKIGDVEYQGDGSKAIFFYIADGRVDFRQLIKVYDETFRHRSLGRNVSYKHLIKLECYKLLKDILGIEEYKPFKMYW